MMAHSAGDVLNAPTLNDGRQAELSLEPVELSREILREARAVRTPEQCTRLGELAGRLRGVDPGRIEGDASRISFWANLYNALLLHCLCLRPVRGSMLRHLRLFDKVAYAVGGSRYPLDLIEHGLLRRNRRPPLHLRRPLRVSDPRNAAAPDRLDPRIHFALNCGARSCPPVQVYDPTTLHDQLEGGTRAYLQVETALDAKRCRVTLPRLMRLYAADFGGRDGQLDFAARHLPELEDCLHRDAARVRVKYGRFDWTAASNSSP